MQQQEQTELLDELPQIFDDQDEGHSMQDDVDAIVDAALLEIEKRDANPLVIALALGEFEKKVVQDYI